MSISKIVVWLKHRLTNQKSICTLFLLKKIKSISKIFVVFFVNVTNFYNIFKAIFYFDSKKKLQKFIQFAIDVWFSKWNYSFVVKRWITIYHSNLIERDKKRIADMFEKSNQINFFEFDSLIKFLIANERYELRTNNSNIKNVCNWMIFKNKNVLIQRKNKCVRKVEFEYCFLLIFRWICNKIDLFKIKKSRNLLLKTYIFNQKKNVDYDFDRNDDFQIKSMIQTTKNVHKTKQRKKQISTYIKLINFFCNKLCELKRYDDDVYIEYVKQKLIKFAMCCSFCNDDYISKHRLYFAFKKFDNFFHVYFTKKLTEWKNEKIRTTYANFHIFMFESIIFLIDFWILSFNLLNFWLIEMHWFDFVENDSIENCIKMRFWICVSIFNFSKIQKMNFTKHDELRLQRKKKQLFAKRKNCRMKKKLKLKNLFENVKNNETLD